MNEKMKERKYLFYNGAICEDPVGVPHNVPRCQSTKRFSCSSVMKIRIVVGWRRVHAGSQPLNMNIGPSFASDARITPSVDCTVVEEV